MTDFNGNGDQQQQFNPMWQNQNEYQYSNTQQNEDHMTNMNSSNMYE